MLPSRCVGCGAGGSYFCAGCAAGAERASWPSLPAASALRDLIAPYAYEGAPRDAVRWLKYRNVRALAPAMAAPMARELALTIPAPFALAPVPLHPARLRERGYNQAELLAREVASTLGAPLRTDLLRRTRATEAQVGAASRTARVRNVEGAFAARAALDGEAIVLVDDVTTTGATLESAASALLAAGAGSVYGLAFAYEERRSG